MKKVRNVYVIGSKEHKYIKIGSSSNVGRRLIELSTGSCFELEILYQTIGLVNAYDVEKDIHIKLSKDNKILEWFSTSPKEAIGVIKEIVLNSGQIDDMSLAYIQGTTVTQLSKDYKVTRQGILYRLKSAGIHNNSENLQHYNTPKYLSRHKLEPMAAKAAVYLFHGTNIAKSGKDYRVRRWHKGEFKYFYFDTENEAKAFRDNKT